MNTGSHRLEALATSEVRLLFADFLRRRELTPHLDLDTFCDEHPEHAEALRAIDEHWRSLSRLTPDRSEDAESESDSASLLNAGPPPVDAPPADGEVRQRPVTETLEEGPVSGCGEGNVDLDALVEQLAANRAPSDRYHIVRRIAEGGMGEVFEVVDRDLKRRLAMKRLRRGPPHGSQSSSRSLQLGRFLEEAHVIGQLHHPGVVPIHELGVDEQGNVFFTMALVRGETLDQVIAWSTVEEEGWNRPRAIGVLVDVCETLAYAHARGVIHRDVKPANVMVGQFGETYLMDWGLARIVARPDRHDLRLFDGLPFDDEDDPIETPDSPVLTMDGTVIGTPQYMAPEQALGRIEEIDERSDIYAIGSILYQLLSGRMPYSQPDRRRTAREVVRLVQDGPPTPVLELNPDLPGEIISICEKAMARNADERYPSMRAFANDLRAFLETRVVTAHAVGTVPQVRKWISRNRPLAALLAGALAIPPLLFFGTSAYISQQAKSDAAQSKLEFERQARVEVDSLNEQLASANDDLVNANDELARTSLDLTRANEALERQNKAAKSAKEIADLARSDAEKERDVADAVLTYFIRLFEVSDELGTQRMSADELLRRGVEELGAHFEAGSREKARLQGMLGIAMLRMGLFEAAEPLLAECHAHFVAKDGESAETALVWLPYRATVSRGLGRTGEAEQFLRRCIELNGDIAPGTGGFEARRELADLLQSRGDDEEAESLLRLLLDVARDQSTGDVRQSLRSSLDLALLYETQGSLEKAKGLLSASLTEARAQFGDDDVLVAECRRRLIDLLADPSLIGTDLKWLTSWGEARRARTLCEEWSASAQRLWGPDHGETLEAEAMLSLLSLFTRSGNMDAAVAAVQRAVDHFTPSHPRALRLELMLASRERFGNRIPEAEARLGPLIERITEVLGGDHPWVWRAQHQQAELLIQRMDLSSAERVLRDALAEASPTNREAPEILDLTLSLAGVLVSRGKPLEALGILRSSVDPLRGSPWLGQPRASELLLLAGQLELARTDEAAQPQYGVEMIREATEARIQSLGLDHTLTASAQEALGQAFLQLGRAEEAIEPLELSYLNAEDAAALLDLLVADDELAGSFSLRAVWGRALDAIIDRRYELLEKARDLADQ